jgi:diaminopimelate decarboxylase
MYDLDIEPGRALLDQCGLVLASVREVREEGGETLVRLDVNARDVCLEEHGLLMDPVLLPRSAPGDPAPAGVYLLGNLCLESDLITRRKVFLPARPVPGDLLAFVNTAGYFMDFSATGALHQPIGRKVAVTPDGCRWRWSLDEQYWPVHRAGEVEAA